jgi:hypothetical protein
MEVWLQTVLQRNFKLLKKIKSQFSGVIILCDEANALRKIRSEIAVSFVIGSSQNFRHDCRYNRFTTLPTEDARHRAKSVPPVVLVTLGNWLWRRARAGWDCQTKGRRYRPT